MRARWGSLCWARSFPPSRPRSGASSGAASTDDELAAEVDTLARQLAAAPTRGLARTKQAMLEGSSRTLEQQLDVERDYQQELGHSADYAEGVAAFMEKRVPRFNGR